MYHRRKQRRNDFRALVITLILIALVFIASYLVNNPVIGWTVLGLIIAITLIFIIFKFNSHANSNQKIPSQYITQERVPIPPYKRSELYSRSLRRCENPVCHARGELQVHHVDMNHSNNNLYNLVVLCPNCHQEAHNGNITCTQIHNWINMDWYQLRQRRQKKQFQHSFN